MPEVNAPQQQQPMELASTDSAVVTQQPTVSMKEAQENMNTDMSLRGGCGESLDCCGMTESCGCC
ncbi:hypothetical protein Daus18300_012602 [Diaporthe australafricana]|uniref:Uncharacterized protein n=1 Tax=Diaporthe australafricana TaxID=127596 RepID=A0ABR3W2B8_9PEZI